MSEVTATQKQHRSRQSGRKASKKLKKDPTQADNSTVRRNPKAFTFHSAVRAARTAHRAADVAEKKTHIPLVDRTPVEPPPIVVAIVGPPKVGKSTLLECLVKHFTRQKLTNVQGPVTVVSGKKRRLTFIECNNDINCMIDVAKVADLVLLLVDASYGFEMETFEFLHICQVHGMPRILGVLTHLDVLKNTKRLKIVKKTLKHRFWTEVYQGAKLFYLSGLINEQYLKNEVKNLARFISVMKFRPLTWRSTHPYVLADRMEDLTDSTAVHLNPKCDRTVCLYGYVRGIPLKADSAVHVCGVGDARINGLSFLPDPCPLPEKERKRSLNEKERLLYAPFSGVGGIIYDKDAVYIDLGGSHSHKDAKSRERPAHPLLSSLMQMGQTLDRKIADSSLALFNKSEPIRRLDDEVEDEEQEDEDDVSSVDDVSMGELSNEENDEMHDEENEDSPKKQRFDGSRITLNSTKADLFKRASDAFQQRRLAAQTLNWARMVYGHREPTILMTPPLDNDTDDLAGGLLKLVNRNASLGDQEAAGGFEDCTQSNAQGSRPDWNLEESFDRIRDCFTSGQWAAGEDAQALLDEHKKHAAGYVGSPVKEDEESSADDPDEELFGDFEDMETGEVHKANHAEDSSVVANAASKDKTVDDTQTQEQRLAKKRKLKQMFDAEYDEGSKFYVDLKQEVDEQAQLNKSAFEHLEDSERVLLEGFRPGMYVRIELQGVPYEFIQNFDATYPYIVGGLLPGEEQLGCVQARFLKHRWHKRILKVRDPLVISIGWRRIQTMPIYSMQDHNGRNRMLKYTPEHLHCHASFWGPITPQNSGIVAVQSLRNDTKEFRLAATGVVLNLDKSLIISKKLKLIGVPLEVHKKTAFVKNMFTSALEVAKFEGVAIRTVSGIRGQIKKPIKTPPGAFRATFEDKILMKDIVFARTWCSVEVPQFCTPVTSLLLPGEEKKAWQGMKTVGQLRFERGISVPQKESSLYRPIERQPFHSEPLNVPAKLQKEVPYHFKPKQPAEVKQQKKGKLISRHTAVVLEPHESKIAELMKMLRTVHDHQESKEREAMVERVNKHRKEMQKAESKRQTHVKNTTQRICRMISQMEKKRLRAATKGGRSKRR